MKVNRFREGETFFVGYGNFGSLEGVYVVGIASKTLFFSQWGKAIFGPELQSDRWYHVAVTNTSNSTSLYLDGDLVASGILPSTWLAATIWYAVW